MKCSPLIIVVIALLFAITETTVAQKVEYLTSIGGSENGGPLIRPSGIAVDNDGAIYAASSPGSNTTVFDTESDFSKSDAHECFDVTWQQHQKLLNEGKLSDSDVEECERLQQEAAEVLGLDPDTINNKF